MYSYRTCTLASARELLHIVLVNETQGGLHLVPLQQRRHWRSSRAQPAVPVAGQLIGHNDVRATWALVKAEAGPVPELGQVGAGGLAQQLSPLQKSTSTNAVNIQYMSCWTFRCLFFVVGVHDYFLQLGSTVALLDLSFRIKTSCFKKKRRTWLTIEITCNAKPSYLFF